MKKVLIIGSAGMLGHVVYLYLKRTGKYHLLATSNRLCFPENSLQLDVTEKAKTESLILEHKPDVVINCVGVLIRGSKNDPSNAIYINAYFPHSLAKILGNYGGKLIHISTDCVFSGSKGNYTEDDFKDATDFYGMSKSLGEVNYDNHLTLRTSIIGPELKENGEGLFDWFMKSTGNIKGYTNAIWSGVSTFELAKVISNVLNQNQSGLINITNGVPINKFELLNLFKKVFHRKDLSIEKYAEYKSDKSLKSNRRDFDYSVPSYEEMLTEMKKFMQKNQEIYSKYKF